MTTVLYAEINVFSIVILLFIARKAAIGNKTQNTRFFVFSASFAAAANFFDFFWKTSTAGIFEVPVSVHLFINFMYFMCFGISTYCWFLYSENMAKREKIESKRTMIIFALPLALLFVLLIVSMFNGCIFYFDENMVYHRGPLFYLQPTLAYGYIAVACLNNFIWAFKKDNPLYKEELIAIATFGVPPIVCLFVQIFFQDAPLITLGITVSFVISYINFLDLLISADPLTGIHNRRSLYRHLEARMSELRREERLAFYFMDVDGFKQVNDVHGHAEGDRVLKAVAAALDDLALQTKGFCSRYGGDEFVFIKNIGKDEDIDFIKTDIQESIWEKTKKMNLLCSVEVSIGYAEYPLQAATMQELIASADESMYNVKMAKKLKR